MARIIVAGYIARYPLGGQIWAHLQYVLGLKQLGHDVFFFEDFGWHDSCYDPARNCMSDDAAYGLQMLCAVMRRFDVRWVFRNAQQTYHGLSTHTAHGVIHDADLLINLSGVTWFDGFENIPQRAFVDEDPLFTQVRAAHDADFLNLLTAHQQRFSYGHNIGQPQCSVPTLGLTWQPFCQPMVLAEWPTCFDAHAEKFTTVMSWNAYGAVEWNGVRYSQKAAEFMCVLDLPRRTTQPFELALSGDDVPVSELTERGWQISEPLAVSRTLETYRDYIQRSRGEFSVAKHAYVSTHSGWFSDRSAAYLASGKPVVLQETGYSEWLPTSEGLLAFSNIDEAREAIKRVNADYAQHAHGARAIAAEYFDARKLLATLLTRI